MPISEPNSRLWLDACRRMVDGIERMLASLPTTADRAVVVGDGAGGDRTLVIDEAAEQIVFDELQKIADLGLAFTAIGEERGSVTFGEGEPELLVVIDPIDGSLNAKRAGGPCALSVAVATGPTIADVFFGFVHDLHSGEEWVAELGGGAALNGKHLDPSVPARFRETGHLEVMGIESADPRRLVHAADALTEATYRVRALGAIAVTLCQVAAGRYDAMLSLKKCRAVDAAAAQLIVREAGGEVAFHGLPGGPLSAPLDLDGHAPVTAGRCEDSLAVAIRVSERTGASLAI